MLSPKNAIIAVTYKCNSRCLTCDIWKKPPGKELSPAIYKKLPSSLVDINITGGEPFLRNDLPEIIKIIKKRCPKSRIIINSNGLLSDEIYNLSARIIKIDPQTAIRISLDGWGKNHDKIRGLAESFSKARQTLKKLKKIPVRDLGISFTLIRQNQSEMLKVFDFCQKNNLQFSLTAATSSAIYFGRGKEKLRPVINKQLLSDFSALEKRHYKKFYLKNWVRGWFVSSLKNYLTSGKRPLKCDAGKNFFYLDPQGRIYTCHLKNWQIGNINSGKKVCFEKYSCRVNKCQDCWMICTAKTAMLASKHKVLYQTLYQKIRNL